MSVDAAFFFGKLFGGAALAVVATIALIAWLGGMAALEPDLARIERLRADAANVDPLQAEDVIGQVTSMNQRIVANQSFNDQWWSGWSVPDEWDSVELIPVPAP